MAINMHSLFDKDATVCGDSVPQMLVYSHTDISLH